MRVVTVGQRLVGDRNRAAGALGYILSGHFDMDAATKTAFGAMNGKKAAYFSENTFERPRLIAARRFDDIAVHRVARPDNRMPFALHRAHQRRKPALDLVIAVSERSA